jgi:hypothetical protein
LRDAIAAYLKGLPHSAFDCLERGIECVPNEFRRQIVQNVTHPFLNELYRVRREREHGTTFGKGELFHIPFQLQHLVSRQRYSIPGLPCLYLGGSLYVCWNELDMPSVDSLHVARFKVASGQTISVLDFTERPRHLVEKLRKNPTASQYPSAVDVYSACAVWWPLMALASIRRKHHRDAPFVAEYIIPQLILQWITKHYEPDLDGIACSSVRCKAHADDPALLANTVFPAKAIATSGHCERLRRKFELSEPVSWSLIEKIHMHFMTPRVSFQKIEFFPGHQSPYMKTNFFEVETKVLAREVATF